MRRSHCAFLAASGAAVVCVTAGGAGAGVFATSVVSYDAGTGAATGYTDSSAAIGSPTRTSGFDLRVTPFNPAFQASEVVSIGKGGHLTLAFDSPVVNDPANPFEIDLLIFGTSFFYAEDFSPLAEHLWKPGGVVEVSADGIAWNPIAGAVASGLFPAAGWLDTTDPFGGDGGLSPTNFHLPVDPSFSPWGKGFAELQAGYAGSGGGAGIDLSLAGLASISYIRISNPIDASHAIGIDAVSDVVPAAPTAALVPLGLMLIARRRAR